MANTNWEIERLEKRDEALQKLKEIKEQEKEHKFVYVPHPNNPKTMIRRRVN